MRSLPLFTICFLFSIQSLFAQDMNKGFKLLENGDFLEAKNFFQTILKEYPTNKTARLCYGRAVGLSGTPKEANEIFTSLLKEFPDDLEIQLNYAESLLWNSEFSKAKTYYAKLVHAHPKSFPALLGYANTLSNLKEYQNALIYVNKALTVSPGNPNAMLSKKYIRLGYAYLLQQHEDFEKAVPLLEENLIDFPKDSNTLLQMANLYIIMKDFEKAKIAYKALNTSKEDEIRSLIGLALVSHLEKNDTEALAIAKNAMEKVTIINNESLYKSAVERYIQALIWNKKFSKANVLISDLDKKYPNENWVLALSATANIYMSKFDKSITTYKKILENDSKSFDGNLGLANALFANDDFLGSYAATEKTLEVFKDQKDALGLKKKLILKFTPSLEQKVAYNFDSGNNNAITSATTLTFPLSTRFSLIGDYSSKHTENTITKNTASSHHIKLGANYLLFPGTYLKSAIGIDNVTSQTTTYNQFLMNVSVSAKPFPLHQVEVGYLKKLENFNADLLERKIVSDNLFMNYNLNTHLNVGLYTQYFYTTQNDNNARHLFFTSLYYTFKENPVIKGGINYQFITFKDQVPTIYFSPSQFNNMELFVELLKDENSSKEKQWFYHAGGALGLQKIENDDKQLTYRIQTKIGYKFSDRLLMNAYGQYTNIASATAAGFSFTEIGLRLKWLLSSKTNVFKTL
ncbi:conserved exported hypothetical protein [Tenacibaculum amylolyticum]